MKIRKYALCVILGSFVLLVAPALRADSFVYTVTENLLSFPSFDTQFSFTEPTILTSGDTTAITPVSGSPATEFLWSSTSGGCSVGTSSGAFACILYSNGSELLGFFPSGSFSAPGTYVSDSGDTTVTISQVVPTPEPSSLILLGTGCLALIGLRRKRADQCPSMN
jgi:PEP-CTERM motif